jgi:hypothetical protein
MRGVMFIGYAIETLRAEVPLNSASTPGVEAGLAAGRRSRDSGGTATMWVNPMRPWHVPRDSDCSTLHPFAQNGDQVKGPPQADQFKVPSYGRGCFTVPADQDLGIQASATISRAT